MSTTSRIMSCSERDVWNVLGDGWLMGVWVVGASRIRDVDRSWPELGATVHHSVGVWPLLTNDTTTVIAHNDARMTLNAKAWPAGEAEVVISTETVPAGTRVTITEDATKGPGLFIPRPLRSAGLTWRNTESLRRLAYLAENRRPASALTPGGSDHTPSGEMS